MCLLSQGNQDLFKSQPFSLTIFLFLTFFVYYDCFTKQTILEKGEIHEVGLKIDPGQSGVVESCEGDRTSARSYNAESS